MSGRHAPGPGAAGPRALARRRSPRCSPPRLTMIRCRPGRRASHDRQRPALADRRRPPRDNVRSAAAAIGVHPGDTVDFTASALPTAGCEKPAWAACSTACWARWLAFQVEGRLLRPARRGAKHTRGPTRCAGGQDVRLPGQGHLHLHLDVAQVVVRLLGPTSVHEQRRRQPAAGRRRQAQRHQPVRRRDRGRRQPAQGRHLDPAARASRWRRAAGRRPAADRRACPGVTLPTIHASVPNLLPASPRRQPRQPATTTGPPAPRARTTPRPALDVPEHGRADGRRRRRVRRRRRLRQRRPGRQHGAAAPPALASPARAGQRRRPRAAGSPTPVTPKHQDGRPRLAQPARRPASCRSSWRSSRSSRWPWSPAPTPGCSCCRKRLTSARRRSARTAPISGRPARRA